MVKLVIASDIRLMKDGLPKQLRQTIVEHLTMNNPEYGRAQKYGRATYGISPTISLYADEGDALILPRGYGRTLQNLMIAHRIRFEVSDHRLMLPHVKYEKPSLNLRPYQAAAVEALVRGKQGGIVAPCGSGKTIMGLAAIAGVGQPALWVTHTKELVEQTRKTACSFLQMRPQEVGIIGDGQNSHSERLTIALVQTLAKMDKGRLEGKYGAIFVDEAHHMAAETFFNTIGRFPARYRLWASATPTRNDGKTKMIYAVGGPILHTIKQNEVPTIIPHLKVVETVYNGRATDWQPLVSDLLQDKKRNALIADVVTKNAIGHYSLVLSERVEHLRILYALFTERLPGTCIEILTGATPRRKRNEIMNQAKGKHVGILLAVNIAKEGLDIPHLDRLYIAGPLRSQTTVQQEVGRVMRPADGKKDAVVYDFHDVHSPILHAQFQQRSSVYKRLEMQEVALEALQ